MNYVNSKFQIKKQRVRPENLTRVLIGEQNEFDVEQKSHLNYDLFLAHREEILARKDLTHQLWLMMKAG